MKPRPTQAAFRLAEALQHPDAWVNTPWNRNIESLARDLYLFLHPRERARSATCIGGGSKRRTCSCSYCGNVLDTEAAKWKTTRHFARAMELGHQCEARVRFERRAAQLLAAAELVISRRTKLLKDVLEREILSSAEREILSSAEKQTKGQPALKLCAL